jgi:hypothetical protein
MRRVLYHTRTSVIEYTSADHLGRRSPYFRVEAAAFPRFSKLREFSLSNFDKVDALFPVLSRSVDFASLLQLNIFECPESYDFFSALHKHVQYEEVALQHLGLSIDGKDHVIAEFLGLCHALQTLHITMWGAGASFSATFLHHLGHVIPSLRTLAIHEIELENQPQLAEVGHRIVLGSLRNSFHRLCFLGFQLERGATYEAERERAIDFQKPLVSLLRSHTKFSILPKAVPVGLHYTTNTYIIQENFDHLAGLRVIHFRFGKFRPQPNDDEDEFRTPYEIAQDIQRFANAFVAYLEQNKLCSNLKAMIFGTHWIPGEDDEELVSASGYYPRHCFVKGYQVDVLHRKTAIAVPVPAYRIRELEPECDLLDFDPECYWVGSIPGRLQF